MRALEYAELLGIDPFEEERPDPLGRETPAPAYEPGRSSPSGPLGLNHPPSPKLDTGAYAPEVLPDRMSMGEMFRRQGEALGRKAAPNEDWLQALDRYQESYNPFASWRARKDLARAREYSGREGGMQLDYMPDREVRRELDRFYDIAPPRDFLQKAFAQTPNTWSQDKKLLWAKANYASKTSMDWDKELDDRDPGLLTRGAVFASQQAPYRASFAMGAPLAAGARGALSVLPGVAARAGGWALSRAPFMAGEGMTKYAELRAPELALDEQGMPMRVGEGSGGTEALLKAGGSAFSQAFVEDVGGRLALRGAKAVGMKLPTWIAGRPVANRAMDILAEKGYRLPERMPFEEKVARLNEYWGELAPELPGVRKYLLRDPLSAGVRGRLGNLRIRLSPAMRAINEATGLSSFGEEVIGEEGGQALVDAVFNLNNQYEQAGPQNLPDALRQFVEQLPDTALTLGLMMWTQHGVSAPHEIRQRKTVRNALSDLRDMGYARPPEADLALLRREAATDPEAARALQALESATVPDEAAVKKMSQTDRILLLNNVRDVHAMRYFGEGLGEHDLSVEEIARMDPAERKAQLDVLKDRWYRKRFMDLGVPQSQIDKQMERTEAERNEFIIDRMADNVLRGQGVDPSGMSRKQKRTEIETRFRSALDEQLGALGMYTPGQMAGMTDVDKMNALAEGIKTGPWNAPMPRTGLGEVGEAPNPLGIPVAGLTPSRRETRQQRMMEDVGRAPRGYIGKRPLVKGMPKVEEVSGAETRKAPATTVGAPDVQTSNMEPAGMTVAESRTLRAMNPVDPVHVAELGEDAGSALDSLVAQGLVSRNGAFVQLTEDGKVAQKEAVQAARTSGRVPLARAPKTATDAEEASKPLAPTANYPGINSEVSGQPIETQPTEAQKKAGNYAKGHLRRDGYDISIENPAGSVRRGTDADGKEWATLMHHDYGYIRGTKGPDKDHVDVFIKPGSPEGGPVFVVNQVDPKTGKYDEPKVMMGFGSEEEAREGYLSNYKPGWKGLGSIVPMSQEAFKEWVQSDAPKKGPAPVPEKPKPHMFTSEREARSWMRANGITNAKIRQTDTDLYAVEVSPEDAARAKAPYGWYRNHEDAFRYMQGATDEFNRGPYSRAYVSDYRGVTPEQVRSEERKAKKGKEAEHAAKEGIVAEGNQPEHRGTEAGGLPAETGGGDRHGQGGEGQAEEVAATEKAPAGEGVKPSPVAVPESSPTPPVAAEPKTTIRGTRGTEKAVAATQPVVVDDSTRETTDKRANVIRRVVRETFGDRVPCMVVTSQADMPVRVKRARLLQGRMVDGEGRALSEKEKKAAVQAMSEGELDVALKQLGKVTHAYYDHGQVVFVLADMLAGARSSGMTLEQFTLAKVMHEYGVHDGLRKMARDLFGEDWAEKLDDLLNEMFDFMERDGMLSLFPESRRAEVAGLNDARLAEEYLAFLGERMTGAFSKSELAEIERTARDLTAKEKSLWRKLVELLKKALRSLNVSLGDSDAEKIVRLAIAYEKGLVTLSKAEGPKWKFEPVMGTKEDFHTPKAGLLKDTEKHGIISTEGKGDERAIRSENAGDAEGPIGVLEPGVGGAVRGESGAAERAPQKPERTGGIPERPGDTGEQPSVADVEEVAEHAGGYAERGGDGGGVRSGKRGVRPGAIPEAGGSATSEGPGGVGGAGPGLVRGESETNFRIGPSDILAPSGQISKIRANIKALRLLKKIEDAKRHATPEEQRVLAQYTGWGHSPQVFDTIKAGQHERQSSLAREWGSKYYEHYKALRALLSEDEWNAAADSTLNAHYTSREVISAMWKIVEHLGFTGGTVLEPAAGIGHFFGLMPAEVARSSKLIGVELDQISGRILRQLYPGATLFLKGFEKVPLPPNTVDVAITNVPFAKEGPRDARDRYGMAMNLHNYFLARMLDAVKPGGLVVAISTHFTMDGAKEQRELLAEKADLLGAIRLPKTAFKDNAGTEVVTDILVFRKPDGASRRGVAWAGTQQIKVKEGDTLPVNEYFASHPDMMLGIPSSTGSMYGGSKEFTLLPRPGQNLADDIRAALTRIEGDVFSHESAESVDIAALSREPAEDEGALSVRNGQLVVMRNGVYVDAGQEYPRLAAKATQARALDYIKLRDAYDDLVSAMRDDATTEADLIPLREVLNNLYDGYVAKHGYLNGQASRPFSVDPSYYTVMGLEVEDSRDNKKRTYKKSDVFTRRTVRGVTAPAVASNLDDALRISMAFHGRLDLAYMASMLSKTEAEVRGELLKGGYAFENPTTGLLETPDVYLTGNVVRKLREAEAAAKDDVRYQQNVDALRGVQPAPIPWERIYVRLGSTWIPDTVVQEFAREILQDPHLRVSYNRTSDAWDVVSGSWSEANRSTWGGNGFTGDYLLRLGLNMGRPSITRQVEDAKGNKRTVVDIEATVMAQSSLKRMQDTFVQWLNEDTQRVRALERLYNEEKNLYVRPVFNGQHLEFPGASDALNLRPYQKNVVWRLLQKMRGVLAHAVGAGKTRVMIATAMEARRMGLASKPMIVVQNSTLMQFAATFRECYPGARVLIAGRKDLDADKRQRFLSRIASGDYDAVVIAQSSFDLIPHDPHVLVDYLNAQISDVSDALAKQGADPTKRGGRNETMSVKQLRRQRKKYMEWLEKAQERLIERQRDAIYWEGLGVDLLMIDEAHQYKKPPFFTKLDRLVGLSTEMSLRSLNLAVKARHVRAKQNGRGVILATGTPVTNTLGEAWHMTNYIAPDLLKESGIETFDRFVATFCQVEPGYEQNAAGRLVAKQTITKFGNLPELKQILHSMWDVITTEELHGILPQLGEAVPRIKGGKPEIVEIPLSEANRDFKELLRGIYDAFNALEGATKRTYSWVPVLTYNAGRAAALDIRLVLPNAPDDPGSKINTAVRNIVDIYHEVAKEKGTQLVFLDQRNKQNMNNLWAFYHGDPHAAEAAIDEESEEEDDDTSEIQDFLHRDIQRKLIDAGIPASQIALMADHDTDAKKEALFEKVNSGEVRVLIGSTAKMGIGVNVQERLYALHHVDAPWLPAELEQREGRIVRFGNTFPEVRILSYGMKGTLDAAIYSKLLRKARGIRQLLSVESTGHSAEDPASADLLTFEEQVRALSDDPLAIEKMMLDNELRTLTIEQEGYMRKQRNLRERRDQLKDAIAAGKADVAAARDLIKRLPQLTEADVSGTIDGVTAKGIDKISEAINKASKRRLDEMEKATENGSRAPDEQVAALERNRLFDGTIGPFTVRSYGGVSEEKDIQDGRLVKRYETSVRTVISGGPLAQAITRNIRYGRDIVRAVIDVRADVEEYAEREEARVERNGRDMEEVEKNLGQPWDKAARLDEVRQRLEEIAAHVVDREEAARRGGVASRRVEVAKTDRARAETGATRVSERGQTAIAGLEAAAAAQELIDIRVAEAKAIAEGGYLEVTPEVEAVYRDIFQRLPQMAADMPNRSALMDEIEKEIYDRTGRDFGEGEEDDPLYSEKLIFARAVEEEVDAVKNGKRPYPGFNAGIPDVRFSAENAEDVVVVTGRQFTGATVRERRLKARAWALANLRGTYRNEDTGWDIEISRAGIEKATSGNVSDDHIESLRALPEMIEKAVLAQTREDRGQNPDIKAIHLLDVSLKMENRPYRVRIVVKETNAKTYYVHSLVEMKKPEESVEAMNRSSVGTHRPSGSGSIVPQAGEGVNKAS